MDINQQEIAALERKVGDQAASPLFAKLAHLYLESGRAKDALRICDAGLANYPFYSTAHLIKGKALLHLGMNGEARREFEFVHGWLPMNPTVAQLLESVPLSEDETLQGTDKGKPQPAGFAEASSPEGFAAAPAMEGEGQIAGGTTMAPEPSAEDSTNVFGLPSEAPAEEAGQTVETPETQISDAGDAFAQFGGGEVAAPPSGGTETDFASYAQRKEQELGETGVMSLEDYLAADPVAAPPETQAEPSGPDEDPFAAAGFGTAGPETVGSEATAEADAPAAEDSSPAFAGFGEPEASLEEPAPSGEQETPATEGSTSAFEEFGGGEQEPAAAMETFPEETGSDPDTASAFGETEEQISPAAEAPGEALSADQQDDFGSTAEPPAETESSTIEPTEQAEKTSDTDIFAGFAGPGEESGEATGGETPESEAQEPEESAFPDFSGIPTAEEPESTDEQQPAEEESSDDGFGGFEGPPAEDPAPPTQDSDRIGELTEKLQDAKKITPVIDLSNHVASSPSSADEAAVDAGFVTPTLAEIYAKQGWYDDAINAYKTLAKTRPGEEEKFEQRVKELEEEKAKAG